MTWTDERCDTLRTLWTEGLSAGQIAAELGDVTRNAVIGKAHRLNLPGRATAPKVKKEPTQLRPSLPFVVPRPSLPFVVPRPSLPFDGNPITLLELTNRTCRWPVNEDVRNMLYCGRPEADMECRKPYCNQHTQIAWKS